MKRILVLVALSLFLVGCSSTVDQATQSTSASTPTATPVKKTYVVAGKVFHPDSSIQDAAQGWAHGVAKSGNIAGVVWVTDDGAGPNDTIKLDCFNIQQAIWYGLKSTINADGSTTTIKSDFKEVDIKFLASGRGVAACRLTSKTVDKIDQAGLWNDGDYVGAWALYDDASID